MREFVARVSPVCCRHPVEALAWTRQAELVRKQVADWRLAAAASAMLCIGLAAALSTTVSRPAVAVHVFEVDRLVDIPANDGRSSVAALIDAPAALELARSAVSPQERAPDLMRSALVRPNPIPRPSPATLASSARTQR